MALKTTTVVDIGDLLAHAAKLGYDWNTTCELFDKDKIRPIDGHYDLWLGEVENNDYGWSEDSCKIIKDFFDHNKIDKCTVSM